MDMSFATQALAAEWMLARKGTLEAEVYDMPADLEYQISDLKLASMGVSIDALTPAQEHYLNSWTEETV